MRSKKGGMKEYERANPEGEGRLVSVRFVDGEFCFRPRRPPPKSGSFPCFRLSQRFRLFLGDSPRPPLWTSEWDRKKRARESAREAHHVATRRVTGGSERNSPPPPKQRRSPLLSRSLSLSLSCLLPKLSLTRRPAPPSPPAPLLALSLLDLQGVTPSCAYSRSSQKQERKKTNRKASKSSDFFLPLSVSSLSLFSLHRFPPCSFHGAAALPSSTALSAARA